MHAMLAICTRLLPVALGALVLALLVSCGRATEYKRVRLNEAGPEVARVAVTPGKVLLRVAVAAVISPKETLKSYDALLDYVGKRLGRPVELIQRQTYAEINDLVRSAHVDLAFVCSGAYIEGERDFGMELLVAPEVRGKAVYYSYVIVPLDSEARSIADLRGKTFAFSDPLSNSGRLAPAYALLEMGETPDSFFKRYVFTYSHDKSIKAVAEKLVDAAAVDSLVYDFTIARSPAYSGKTRVIGQLGPFGAPPVVVNPGVSAALKAELRSLFTELHRDPAGQGILRDLMIDRFVVPEGRAYDSMREMAAKVRWRGEGR